MQIWKYSPLQQVCQPQFILSLLLTQHLEGALYFWDKAVSAGEQSARAGVYKETFIYVLIFMCYFQQLHIFAL